MVACCQPGVATPPRMVVLTQRRTRNLVDHGGFLSSAKRRGPTATRRTPIKCSRPTRSNPGKVKESSWPPTRSVDGAMRSAPTQRPRVRLGRGLGFSRSTSRPVANDRAKPVDKSDSEPDSNFQLASRLQLSLPSARPGEQGSWCSAEPVMAQAGADVATAAVGTAVWSSMAVLSSRRHEVMLGRFRSRARRSRSVMPPQTPHSI